MTNSSKIVLIQLLCFLNSQTGACYPGVSTLAKACGLDDRQVRRSINELKELSVLTVEQKKKRNSNYNYNYYTFIDKWIKNIIPDRMTKLPDRMTKLPDNIPVKQIEQRFYKYIKNPDRMSGEQIPEQIKIDIEKMKQNYNKEKWTKKTKL